MAERIAECKQSLQEQRLNLKTAKEIGLAIPQSALQ